MNDKTFIAGTLAVLAFSVVLSSGAGTGPDKTTLTMSKHDQTHMDLGIKFRKDQAVAVVIKSNNGKALKASIDDASLNGYLSPITLMDGEISGIQYGTGNEMHDLDMELYQKMKDEFGVGTIVYVLPPMESTINKDSIMSIEFDNATSSEAYSVSGGKLSQVE